MPLPFPPAPVFSSGFIEPRLLSKAARPPGPLWGYSFELKIRR